MTADAEAAVTDFLIVGAGAGGLSLAEALVRHGVDGSRILLVEQAEQLRRDRTFSTFASEDVLRGLPIEHTWSSWTIRHEDHAVTHRGEAPVAYRQIDLDRFRAEALERIRAAGVEVRFGVQVRAIVESSLPGIGAIGLVETHGGALRARRVFDGRPTKPSANALFQSFVGHRVRTSGPVFDPDSCELMDFRSPNRGLGSFVYVLPYAPDEALIEATTIGLRPAPEQHHEADVRQYLANRYGLDPTMDVEFLERESSALVMDPDFEEAGGRGPVTKIGSAGGAIRPATGYGFAACRRFAERFAPRLARSIDAPAPRHHSPTLRRLDRIFLAYLRRPGVDVADLFVRFADRLSPETFARFLADDPHKADLLRVARALPPWPLLSTAVRTLSRRRSA